MRVHGRENEVSRHAGLHCGAGGLLVADLADQEHVGVAAQDRAQAAGEGEAALGRDLDLVDAPDLVLDRVLDRHQHASRVVQHV